MSRLGRLGVLYLAYQQVLSSSRRGCLSSATVSKIFGLPCTAFAFLLLSLIGFALCVSNFSLSNICLIFVALNVFGKFLSGVVLVVL